MVDIRLWNLNINTAISYLNISLIVSKLCCFISGKTSSLRLSPKVSRINLLQIP